MSPATPAPGRSEGEPADVDSSAAVRGRSEGEPADVDSSAAVRGRSEGEPAEVDSSATVPGAGPAEPVRCTACGEPTTPRARYCEACGAALRPGGDLRADRCPGCAAPYDAVDADGYCTVCGLRRPDPRDHREVVLDDDLAGVTDRGLRHRRNEDALALARPDPTSAVVVVCDGVSTTERPDDAAQAAADAACAVLVEAVHSRADLAEATRGAVDAAQDAVLSIPSGPSGPAGLGPPSCTIVTAAVRNGVATVGWLGDSRAYHLADDGSVTLLTVDDSWATAQIAAGALSQAEAQADPRAHVITRWLGRDAPATVPSAVTTTLGRGERLLVCSDGLWNYAEPPASLAALVARLDAGPPAATACDLARSLVDYARDQGGHDNITVVVCADGSPPSDPSHREQ